eukprot:symbB.v1.2.017498.t1/scaffold1358.1/size123611/4
MFQEPVERTLANDGNDGRSDVAPWMDCKSEGLPLKSETSLASESSINLSQNFPRSSASFSAPTTASATKRRLKKDKKPSIVVANDVSRVQGPLRYFVRLLQWSTGFCSAETKPTTPQSVQSSLRSFRSSSPRSAEPKDLDELVRRRPFANRFIQYSLEVDSEISPGSRAWLASSQRRIQR